MKLGITLVGSFVIFMSICQVESKKKKDVDLQSKETSTADIIRLVLKIIFGVASAMGYGENLSSFMNGSFVPPGDDYDDDYDDDVFSGFF